MSADAVPPDRPPHEGAPSGKPPRRARYPGPHPRRFEQRYKEHAPERHPEIVGAVRARGATPAGQHVSILVAEVLAVLAPRPGERGVDATLGYGGHAQALLAAVQPGGALLGLDVDARELPRTEERLRAAGFDSAQFLARRTNFAGLSRALADVGWSDGVDFVLADLGVSSMQLDDPARGFTFKADGPLDMRMNPARAVSAAQLLATIERDELASLLRENADEPHAERIAHALCARRGTLDTTLALARTVGRALAPVASPDDADKSVRRVFQALRIAVNDEFGVLDSLLGQLPFVLRPGGRACFLTFHSGEDRRVKHSFERGLNQGRWSAISDEVVRASPLERRDNPRSSSAKLRWARRA